jgi:hypothetical protein
MKYGTLILAIMIGILTDIIFVVVYADCQGSHKTGKRIQGSHKEKYSRQGSHKSERVCQGSLEAEMVLFEFPRLIPHQNEDS